MIIYILGRQPALGLAELESLHGSRAVTPIGHEAALVDGEVNFSILGGSLKAAKHLTTLDTTNPQKVFDYCRKTLPEHLQYIPVGKIKLGVSLYGLAMPVAKLNANVLSLKKTIKQAGRSVRAVPNQDLALSTAQTLHNQLTSPLGMELIFVRHGEKTLVGQVTDVQDIEAYTFRDRSRPKRDAFVGMLPPKLAQIMVNLGTSGIENSAVSESKHLQPEIDKASEPLLEPGAKPLASTRSPKYRILDPFCGTGVVLQEAALQDYGIYGTDISEKMVRYTRDNISWLFDTHHIHTDIYFEVGDAITHTWQQPIDAVICEGYLGQPMSQEPKPEKLVQVMNDCDVILRGFLKNIASQLAPGTPLCVAAPAWFVSGGTKHLPTLDDLEDLGYNHIDFEHADRTDLIYHREDQIVGRELLVLIRR